jgi:hypothetical protein
MTWQIWGSKQALEKRKTSLSLMEVSCRPIIFDSYSFPWGNRTVFLLIKINRPIMFQLFFKPIKLLPK